MKKLFCFFYLEAGEMRKENEKEVQMSNTENRGADLREALCTEENGVNRLSSYSSGINFLKKNLLDLEQEYFAFMDKHSPTVEKLASDDSWQRLSIDG